MQLEDLSENEFWSLLYYRDHKLQHAVEGGPSNLLHNVGSFNSNALSLYLAYLPKSMQKSAWHQSLMLLLKDHSLLLLVQIYQAEIPVERRDG